MANQTSKNKTNQLVSVVQTLNARWARRALALWQGGAANTAPDAVYNGFDEFLSPDCIVATSDIHDDKTRNRIRHGLIDHYLQRKLMPHETEMQAWSRGAAAHVDGEKVYLREIIPWCQKSSTLAKREKLQQETGPLCKLLKPFAVNYWNIVLEILTGALGFDDYIDYCSQKKGIDYDWLYGLCHQLIQASDDVYYDAMETWSRNRFGRGLKTLSRFDAIYLLSLSQWDHLCPADPPTVTLSILKRWGIDPFPMAGLHLDLEPVPGKSAQAISVMVRIPQEVHILMRPEGGWIDIETLWHELGHGMSAVCTDPTLPAVDRELATAFSLSEVYAFLLQRLALSRPVLDKELRLSDKIIDTLSVYRDVKALSVFRRYAAKFISEYDMFTRGDLTDGEPYAKTMARVTGFYHQPESHLFDLVPEFYCADYLLGWLGEAVMNECLVDRFGESGYFDRQTGQWLQSLWRQGNGLDMFTFFKQNGMGEISAAPLLRRWQRLSETKAPW
jgi:hypothetical protein